MDPPIASAQIMKIKPLNKISTDKNVTIIAKTIPKTPKKFPRLDVSGDDNPRRANIKNTPEIKYKDAAKFCVIVLIFLFFLFFVHPQHSLCYQKTAKYIYRSKKYCYKTKYVR